jgi:(p)ppGpp synthase/HD superfamily hydrolase
VKEKVGVVEMAARVAVSAHKDQKRKSDTSPYVVHPFMCALMLTEHRFSDEVIAASLTHDVLEDTEVSESELLERLGEQVVAIIRTVTEDKSLPWEERKKKYVEAVRTSSVEVKAVSIADKIHNMQSLLTAYEKEGSQLWKKFSRGKDKKLWFEEMCLSMFQDTWSHPLIEEYEALVKKLRELE